MEPIAMTTWGANRAIPGRRGRVPVSARMAHAKPATLGTTPMVLMSSKGSRRLPTAPRAIAAF